MSNRIAILLLVIASVPCLAADKLIALTFDDGPRPYVLYGMKQPGAAAGMLDVLDRNGVKATFFVMGWRLTPKTWGETPHETNIGVTCLDAAHDIVRRGHEIENHTYSHADLRIAERKKGEAWVLSDVERGAEVVKAVTGTKPQWLRPPDWDLADDARHDLEKRGFHILTITNQNPVALRDVNSQDYLCAAKGVGCPKPSLAHSVVKTIEQRERKGVFTHVLAFHELSTTTVQLPELIGALKAKGYRFVTVAEYMQVVKNCDGNLTMWPRFPALRGTSSARVIADLSESYASAVLQRGSGKYHHKVPTTTSHSCAKKVNFQPRCDKQLRLEDRPAEQTSQRSQYSSSWE